MNGTTNGLARSFKVFALAGVFLYVAVATLAVIGYLSNQQQSENTRELALRSCQENRVLITQILLRSINSSYEDWLENPQAVLEDYGDFLRSANVPETRIETAVNNTHALLELATPTDCRSP